MNMQGNTGVACHVKWKKKSQIKGTLYECDT
jgi:hypothetical protein